MAVRTTALAVVLALLVAGCGRQPPAAVVFKGPAGGARPAVAADAAGPASVVVERGDTVYAIARRHRVSVRALIDANRLRPPYKLLLGRTLALPRARTHLVERGDTLYGVSRRYGVDMSVLARANGLETPYRLTVGQRLRLPAGPSARAAVAAPAAKPAAVPRRRANAASPPAAPIPGPPPRTAKTFLWPVEGELTARFGLNGGGLHNDGINITASRGTAVRAAAAGIVAYAGNELRGYGNLLLVRHAGGWTTAYAHNERLLVGRGDTVRRGQTIARVGSTGNVATPQAHFELRRGTRAVDPLKYLARN